jgi:hypothetical protein
MSDYIKATNFATKDALASGNPNKIIKGTEIDTEFNSIASAVSSKADINNPSFTGVPAAPTASLGTNTTQLATTAFVLANAPPVPPPFPAGTLMLFQQTAAPTGWTKETTHNNKALRVVSGTAGSGGTTAFTSVFTNQTVSTSISGTSGATTLSTSQIPSHAHTWGPLINATGGGPNVGLSNSASYNSPFDGVTGASGGGGSHTHSVSGSGTSSAVTLNVAYVDLIIASKNS